MYNAQPASLTPNYPELAAQLCALLEGEQDFICNAAQFSAFIMQSLQDLNWAGFYLVRNEALLLGPFQGKVACVHIPFGRGVCGSAAQQRQTIVVDDVHTFPGHIACDAASNAEMVLPLIKDGCLLGVFDIDSPSKGRFSQADRVGLEQLLAVFVLATDC